MLTPRGAFAPVLCAYAAELTPVKDNIRVHLHKRTLIYKGTVCSNSLIANKIVS